jgi:signal transduction histidine kinase
LYAPLHPQADDARLLRGYRPLVNALRDLRPRDFRIAVIVAAVQIGGTVGASHRHGGHGCWWASSCSAPTHLDALAVVLMALGPIALLVRRRYPRAVLAFVFAVGLLYVSLGYVQGPNYVSVAVAVINACMAGDRLAARVAVVAGWVLFLWLPAAFGVSATPSWLAALAIAAWLLLLLAAAEALANRRERAVEARRLREQEARQRAGEERLRIARELHDVLAHNITTINVQSGVALHLIDEQPEQARTALQAINEASADALREVRSALSALRGDGEQPPRAPAAGLDGLGELLSRASAAGVGVSLDVSGDRRPLPASVDLAAFRIVQESLTNVVRHAGATAASVTLTYGDGDLAVQIDDNGRGGAASNGGSGIAGMRERAAALGGRLDAGPAPGGGFRVSAHLPVGSQS